MTNEEFKKMYILYNTLAQKEKRLAYIKDLFSRTGKLDFAHDIEPITNASILQFIVKTIEQEVVELRKVFEAL